MILHGFNFRKMSIVSVCFFVFGIIFGYILFPMLLKKMIKGVSRNSQLNMMHAITKSE